MLPPCRERIVAWINPLAICDVGDRPLGPICAARMLRGRGYSWEIDGQLSKVFIDLRNFLRRRSTPKNWAQTRRSRACSAKPELAFAVTYLAVQCPNRGR